MASGVSFSGLSSGIDWHNIIDQLISVEKNSRIRPLERRQDTSQKKIDIIGQLLSRLNTFQTKSQELADVKAFSLFKAISEDDAILTATAGVGASPGRYSIEVLQKAEFEKIISDSQSSAISALGLSGTFTIQKPDDLGVLQDFDITLATTDSLKDIQTKVNSVDAGVTASVLNISATDHRLIFTNDKEGLAGATYVDTDGILMTLGLLNPSALSNHEVTGTKVNNQTNWDLLIDNGQNLASWTETNGLGADTDIDNNQYRGIAAGGAGSITTLEKNIGALPDQYTFEMSITGDNTEVGMDESFIGEIHNGSTKLAYTISNDGIRVQDNVGTWQLVAPDGLADGETATYRFVVNGGGYAGALSIYKNGTLVAQNIDTQDFLTDDGKITLSTQGLLAPAETHVDELRIASGLIAPGSETSGVVLTAADTFSNIFNSNVKSGDTISISGKDFSGNNVSGTFTITDPDDTSVQSLLTEIETIYGGTVTATITAAGKLKVTDNTAGPSQLILTLTENNEGGGNLDFGTFMVTTPGGPSKNYLQAGLDAMVRIDGIDVTQSSNNLDDLVDGVTFNIQKADPGNVVDINVDRDLDGVIQKAQEFVNEYNNVLKYINEQTAFNRDNTELSGPLLGDSTVQRLKTDLRNSINQVVDNLSGPYDSLSQLGIKSSAFTGELELDQTVFKDALEKDFDNVQRLFIPYGATASSEIVFGRSTSDTQAGVYAVTIDYNAPWSGTIDGNPGDPFGTPPAGILTSNTGPSKGLGLSVLGTSVTSTTVTFTRGIASQMYERIKQITDNLNGYLPDHKENIQKEIERTNERIAFQEERIERYRLRLVTQFTRMEQAMASINAQSSAISNGLNQLSGIFKK